MITVGRNSENAVKERYEKAVANMAGGMKSWSACKAANIDMSTFKKWAAKMGGKIPKKRKKYTKQPKFIDLEHDHSPQIEAAPAKPMATIVVCELSQVQKVLRSLNENH